MDLLGFGNLGELICDRRVGDELGVKEVQLAAQPKLLYTGPAPLPFCLPCTIELPWLLPLFFFQKVMILAPLILSRV